MLAAAIAASGFARPAAAAQKMSPPAPSRPSAPAATPAHIQEPESVWRLGAALGLEVGLGDEDYNAVKVRMDAQHDLQRLSPVASLAFVASLGISHVSGTASVPVVVDPILGVFQNATIEWDANVFELIPAARVTYAASPQLSFFGDGGLGLVYTAANVRVPPSAAGRGTDLVEDGVGGVLRLAGGLVFSPSPALRIAVEAVGLNIRFGNGPGTAFNLVASISHRL
jgi:hypothetical protein